MYYMTTLPSPVGPITLACDDKNLVGLWLEGQKYFGASIGDKWIARDDLPVFAATKAWLDRYFAGAKPCPTELPLAPIGGEFRQAVWQVLCDIPYGGTTTYGQIAAGLGKAPGAARAIGGAVGHNPISIIIPCHRVVGASGGLTGYAGGLDKKTLLLRHEGIIL